MLGVNDKRIDGQIDNVSAVRPFQFAATEEAGFARVTIAIIGGGAGGVGAALALADAGYFVDLYEGKSELLLGTSNKTPGRAGHGYHYIHEKTAKLYLDATIEVVQRFPGCLRGDGQPDDHYLQHGLYCIMKQKRDLPPDKAQFASIYSKEEILKNYAAIKDYYRELVAKDPSKKVFGDPDQFCRILSPAEMEKYRDTINLDIVDTIVDTREELLNWPKLRRTLIDKVIRHPNIRVHLNSRVDMPALRPDSIGFEFQVTDSSSTQVTNHSPTQVRKSLTKKRYIQRADFLINATWEEIERFNQQVDIYMEPESRTNRLKTIIKVRLPPEICNHPSVFFCMGPHAMVSNMGDGTAMTTYALVTNVSQTTGLFIAPQEQQLLDGLVNFEEEIRMAHQIINGVSNYFPRIGQATIEGKGYGIIKTRGTVDLFDPNSEVNKREEIGVEEQLIGWIDNACMKLLHFILNGKEVLALVNKSIHAMRTVNYLSEASLMEYDLVPMSSNALYGKIIEFKCDETGFCYRLLSSGAEEKAGLILWSDLPKDFPRNETAILADKSKVLPLILSSISAVNPAFSCVSVSLITNVKILQRMLSAMLQRYSRASDYELCDLHPRDGRQAVEKMRLSFFGAMRTKQSAMQEISALSITCSQ